MLFHDFHVLSRGDVHPAVSEEQTVVNRGHCVCSVRSTVYYGDIIAACYDVSSAEVLRYFSWYRPVVDSGEKLMSAMRNVYVNQVAVFILEGVRPYQYE